jgi:hypothetical protein
MWPGDQQSGGEQYPQGNPPQQPQGPYGQPNPYTQPGYQQPGYPQQPQQPQQQPPQPQYPQTQPYGTPAPYGQPGYQTPAPGGYQTPPPPGGYPTPQQWGAPVPGGPDGGPPPKNRRNVNIAIAITASVAVIAAIVAGTVYFTGSHKKTDAQDKPASPTATTPKPTATPSATDTPATSGGGDTDNPRGAPSALDVKPVIPGWKVVRRGERNVAFDVPPNWSVDKEGTSIGYDDNKGNPAVVMSAPAYYKHAWCKSSDGTADRAATGTKGGSGAKSLRSAAESEAEAWAYWAYQDNGKGTFSKAQDSKAFHNAHGITGWQAQATASALPKANKCSAPGGVAHTVAWLDPAQKTPTPVVWVLYADTGVSDQLSQSIVHQIEGSIRPLKK